MASAAVVGRGAPSRAAGGEDAVGAEEFAGVGAQAGQQLQLVSHGSAPVRLQDAACVNCAKIGNRQRLNR